MEEGASPPRWALDKKLEEDASMNSSHEGVQVLATERIVVAKTKLEWILLSWKIAAKREEKLNAENFISKLQVHIIL